MNYQSNVVADDNAPGNQGQLVQKGEAHPIVQYVVELLDNREMRVIIYCSLIMLSIFPIFVDSVDLFGSGDEQYIGNEFCDAPLECGLALTGFCIMLIGVAIIIKIVLFSTYDQHHKIYKYIACILLFFGNTLLLITILLMTFKSGTNPKNACFEVSAEVLTEKQEDFCRIQYFGTEILYPLIIYCAFVDFLNLFADKHTKYYMRNRLIWFSIAIFLSSVCTALNLMGNSDIYHKYILANTSYVTCTLGYWLVVLASMSTLLIQCNCIRNWQNERIFSRIIGFMLLIGVLLIQSRTFADLFVFCCICLIMAADIQVIKA